jgi:hypothetical protein
VAKVDMDLALQHDEHYEATKTDSAIWNDQEGLDETESGIIV